MTASRRIIGHAPHEGQGPHVHLPSGFVPLKLCITSEHLHIDIWRPVAIIGRHSDVDIRLAYPDISRRHCRLAFEDGQWRVNDLNSLNGIYVNNFAADESTLFTGDIVRIGCVQLLIESGTQIPNIPGTRSTSSQGLI
jgi:pSer/pThr/pTyr-binding forkhead associated (FHA) protein